MDKDKAKTTKPEADREKTGKQAIRKTFRGIVVSDKMDKTVVVKVESVKIHPLYGKRVVRSEKYKVHDEKNACKTGEAVEFVECRPLSKDKKWRIVKK